MSIAEPSDRRFDVSTREGLLVCYEATIADVFRSAVRLTRADNATAEDLVHETFLQLARAARHGDVTRIGVGWLITTMRRRHFNQLRSTQREQRRLRLVSVRDEHRDQPLATMGARELLSGLSEREQSALVLRYVEDLPVADIADVMDTTVRATESLLQRAKRKVRKEGSA